MAVKTLRAPLVTLVLLVLLSPQVWARPGGGKEEKDWLKDVARAHGLENWAEVTGLKFTFMVELPGRTVVRRWTWYPQKDQVELLEPEKPGVIFSPGKVLAGTQEDAREAHAKFINDSYWLLFPLHLAWDEGLSLTEVHKGATAPGGAQAARLRLEYDPEGGYTPGDVYRLYVDAKDHVLGWDFLPGGDKNKMRTFAWLDPVQFRSLRLYRKHPAPEGQVSITFGGLAVQWQGNEEWNYPMDDETRIEELKQADRDFAAAAHADGLDGWVSFFTADAARVDLFGKVARGEEGIRSVDGALFQDPGIQLRWQPETAGLFAGGRQGFTKGPYQLVRLGEDSETVLGTGYYLSLWRFEDGRWKVYLDTGAQTPAPPAKGD